MRKKNKQQFGAKTSIQFDQESRGRKNDNVIFIICLIIAFVFWGLIKLAEVYNVTYTFKLHYENVPVEKRLTSMSDSTLAVNFSARGFKILRLNIFEDLSILNIDLAETDMIKEGSEYFIYSQELRDQLAGIIGISESEISFSESMLGFKLENLFEKEIDVLANLSIQYKEQYDLYEKEIVTPSRVSVFGPKATIDTLTEVWTENITLQDLEKDRVMQIGISNPYPNLLRFDPEIVEIHLRVEKFTESNIEIPIDFSNVKENIQSFPSTVKVYFKIAQKDFNNIQAGDFNVKPELADVDLREVDRLNLKLTAKPGFIRNEWIVPTSVEFLITK
jgi:hypothetical protein